MGKNPNKINEYRIVDGTVYMKPTNNKDIEFMFDEEDLLSFKEAVTCDYSYKEIWCCSKM